MMKTPAFAVTALLALAGYAQDDALVTREYDVSDLLRSLPSRPAPMLAVMPGEDVQEPEDDSGPSFSEDALVELLQNWCEPGCWDGESTLSFAMGGRLVVRAPEGAHKAIALALPHLRARVAPEIAVDVTVAELTSGSLNELLAGGDAPCALGDRQVRRLEELLRDGVNSRSVRRVRVTAASGRTNHTALLEDSRFLSDIDLDLEGDRVAASAVNADLRLGSTLEVRPAITDLGVLVRFRYVDARTDAEPETLEMAGGARLQFPRVRRRVLASELHVANTAVAFGGALSLPGKPGWQTALFLCPRLDAAVPKPGDAPPCALPTALVDLRGVSNLRESSPVSSDDLLDALLTSVDPESWDNVPGAGVADFDGLLIVRNQAETLAQVRRWLDDWIRRELSSARVEIRLIQAPAGILGEPGQGESPKDLRALVERAESGSDATIVWQTAAVAAQNGRLTLDDVVRRGVVTDYRPVGAQADPEVGLIEWGARLDGRVRWNRDAGRVLIDDFTLSWSTAAEPIATAVHPAAPGAKMHQPRLFHHRFSASPTLVPGEWSLQGVVPVDSGCLYLLVRALATK